MLTQDLSTGQPLLKVINFKKKKKGTSAVLAILRPLCSWILQAPKVDGYFSNHTGSPSYFKV